jgi:hypothetical protein
MASFASDDVSGPISLRGTAKFCFTVALPGGGEGRAIERVAAALNFHVEASTPSGTR